MNKIVLQFSTILLLMVGLCATGFAAGPVAPAQDNQTTISVDATDGIQQSFDQLSDKKQSKLRKYLDHASTTLALPLWAIIVLGVLGFAILMFLIVGLFSRRTGGAGRDRRRPSRRKKIKRF